MSIHDRSRTRPILFFSLVSMQKAPIEGDWGVHYLAPLHLPLSTNLFFPLIPRLSFQNILNLLIQRLQTPVHAAVYALE